jgi:DTW domain-containing protein YfiP
MLSNRLRVLILQHPQEPREERGTARFLPELLEKAEIKTGLSWRNQKAVLGADAEAGKWVLLYLGSAKLPPGTRAPALVFLNKKGLALPTEHIPLTRELEGIVLLDGTWSQAKTLWWRNAWLLKLKRAALFPAEPSVYGNVRKEPRRECLSTAESAALALELLGEKGMFAPVRDQVRAFVQEKRLAGKPEKA